MQVAFCLYCAGWVNEGAMKGHGHIKMYKMWEGFLPPDQAAELDFQHDMVKMGFIQ